MSRKKTILLLRTGGTIESASNKGGKVGPSKHGTIDHGFLDAMKSKLNLDIINEKPLKDENGATTFVDSSVIGLNEWRQIGLMISAYVRERIIDGVVITHGTDTMAYTASVLTFMLENLGIPVLLTGSEIEWDKPESDGPRNLANSLRAITHLAPGVFILFGSRILLGSRAEKIYSGNVNGFESPNYPKIGDVGGAGDIRIFTFLNPGKTLSSADLNVFDNLSSGLFVTEISPDSSPDFLHSIVAPGVLVSGYGLGNVNNAWKETLQELSRRIPVAITTQCIKGGVRPNVYEVGAPETTITCGDMTLACSIVKLRWAIGKANGDLNVVRLSMLENFHGEISTRI